MTTCVNFKASFHVHRVCGNHRNKFQYNVAAAVAVQIIMRGTILVQISLWMRLPQPARDCFVREGLEDTGRVQAKCTCLFIFKDSIAKYLQR